MAKGQKVGMCLVFAVLLGVLSKYALDVSLWSISEGRFGDAQKSMWKAWYNFVLFMAPIDEFAVMNWGLGPATSMHDCAKDATEPPQANLYLELASLSEFEGRVLEVGSGRGGGAATLVRCKCPSEYVGVDLSAGQVAAAEKRFGQKGKCPLSFLEGDAENLPLPDNSFDTVFSVETSHTYPHFEVFVREVFRVLRPGGRFHLTDFRDAAGLDKMVEDMTRVFGGPPIQFTDISQRVAQAIAEDIRPGGARRNLIDSLCPSFMMNFCLQFVGQDAMMGLQNKTKFYSMVLFRKGLDAEKGDRNSP